MTLGDFERVANELIRVKEEIRQLKKQLEIGEQQYNDLVEEKEKLDAENQVLKDYKNVALTYMKNYLKMELNYPNKDVAEHFKMVIDMLNRGNKHGNLVVITDCETQQKEFIEWLEEQIKKEKDDLEKLCELYKIPKENNGAYSFAYSYINKMEAILEKYKQITGVLDEKK